MSYPGSFKVTGSQWTRFPPGGCDLLPTCPLCRQHRRGRLVFWPQDETPHQLPALRKRLLVQLIVWPSCFSSRWVLSRRRYRWWTPALPVCAAGAAQRAFTILRLKNRIPWAVEPDCPDEQWPQTSSARGWVKWVAPSSSASLLCLAPPCRSSLRVPTTPALPWSTVRSFKKHIQTNRWGVLSSKAKNVMNFQSC